MLYWYICELYKSDTILFCEIFTFDMYAKCYFFLYLRIAYLRKIQVSCRNTLFSILLFYEYYLSVLMHITIHYSAQVHSNSE